MIIDESKIIEDVNEQLALACLLADGTCFINNVNVSEDKDKPIYSVAVYVLTSDIFAWGCADAEYIECNDGETPNEIIDLYKLVKEKEFFGIVEWACLKRNLQPQKAVKIDMIKANQWTHELEQLPTNELRLH
jgi:hypothetical protein